MEETPEEKVPETKTETSGGGRPPGKTRVGTGDGGCGFEPPHFAGSVPEGGRPRSLGSLEVEATQIIRAMNEQWDQYCKFRKQPGNSFDARELILLYELLEFVIHDIENCRPFDPRAGEVLTRFATTTRKFKSKRFKMT